MDLCDSLKVQVSCVLFLGGGMGLKDASSSGGWADGGVEEDPSPAAAMELLQFTSSIGLSTGPPPSP